MPRLRNRLAFSAFAAAFALLCALLGGGRAERLTEPGSSVAHVTVALRSASAAADRADERSGSSTAAKRSTSPPAGDLPTPLASPRRESREIENSCETGARSQPRRLARRQLPEARAPPLSRPSRA